MQLEIGFQSHICTLQFINVSRLVFEMERYILYSCIHARATSEPGSAENRNPERSLKHQNIRSKKKTLKYSEQKRKHQNIPRKKKTSKYLEQKRKHHNIRRKKKTT